MGKVDDMLINGHAYPVELTHDMGFRVTIGDKQVEAGSYAELKRLAGREAARQRLDLAIACLVERDGLYARAVLRGKHGRTSQCLMTIDGKKTTVGDWSTCWVGAVTDAELAVLNGLAQAVKDAAVARNFYFQRLKLRAGRPSDEVRKAEEAALKGQA